MKRQIAIFLLLAVLIIAVTSCSPAVREASGVSVPKPAVESAALYPAYVRSGNALGKNGGIGIGNGDRWGFIDETGRFAIQPAFDYVEPFNDNGLAVVHMDGKKGLIDKNGKLVLEPVYTHIGVFENGVAIANLEDSSRIINEKGQIMVEMPYFAVYFRDGFAVFTKSNSMGESRYGYMDQTGRVIGEPRYLDVSPNKDGTAVVMTEERLYQAIDKNGSVIRTLDCEYVGWSSEDLRVYQSKANKKYGYMDDQGNIVIAAAFDQAYPFQDGFAVVSQDKGSAGYLAGAINKKGEYVIETAYPYLYDLGMGFYAAGEKASDSFYSGRKAIVSSEGKRITDYKFQMIEPQGGGLFCVNDGEAAYFVNERFEPVDSLPKLEGSGTMTVLGDVVKADIDRQLKYLKKDGKVIWQGDHTHRLDNGMMVSEQKYRPDQSLLIYYPQLAGHPEQRVLENINQSLRKAFVGNDPVSVRNSETGEFTESIYYSFYAAQNEELLIIEKEGYVYPYGAAHGMPLKHYYHIDLRSGKFYELKDLFKKDNVYLKRLSEIIGKQVEERSRQEDAMLFSEAYNGIDAEQGFTLTETGLRIYFEPYEIAAYAAGFPAFDIPYGEIIGMIDTEGTFWNAFDKQVTITDLP